MSSYIEEVKYKRKLLLNKYLLESNGQCNSIIKENVDAIFVLDLEGNFVQVNTAFEKLLVYSVDEALQMKLQTLIPIKDLNKVLNYFHKSVLGHFENFDSKIINKFNQILDINVMFLPLIFDEQVVGVSGVIKDITELKRKNKEVRKIEEIHRSLTKNVLDIILSVNVLGEIQYISPACKSILGFDPEEMIGQHLKTLFFINDIEGAMQDFNWVFSEQQNGRNTYRLPKKDGSFVWAEILCKPVIDPVTRNIVEMVCVIRDITEQKNNEEVLRSRKKAFREIIEHLPDAVIIVKDLKIQFINQTGIQLFGGLKEEDILNKSILDFIHRDYHQIAINRAKSISDGNIADFLEYKFIRLDGKVIDVELKGIPTVFLEEHANYVYIRDRTETKKTQKLLLQAEKLNIVGQLAAGIAHEVRNPLTAIKGFLQLLESELKERQSYFEIIQSEIDRIDLILTELLALAKPKDINFESIELHSLVEEVKTLIDTQAIVNNIEIEFNSSFRNTPFINGDRNQLKQVLINFLKNAIEAIKNEGSIKIELKSDGLEKIQILIKDSGPGIPQHVLKRIGEPFFTTKENGTGLGIMLSKQIIENHKGTVHFCSDMQGTTVEIILPVNKGTE